MYTCFLSITYTVWIIKSVKYIYEMNIFYGVVIDKICLNAVTHCSLTSIFVELKTGLHTTYK